MGQRKLKFCFKIGVPQKEEMDKWGDYYLVKSFGEALKRKGHQYIIHILPQWNTNEDYDSDVIIHLRGLSKYNLKKQHFNIMWNISHPEDVNLSEYEKYDLILISSLKYSKEIKKKISKPVYPLLQFADTGNFFPDKSTDLKNEILFVGNSRGVMRKIVQDIIPPPKELSIYGTRWEGMIPDKYIKGTWFPNNQLRKLYSSCDVLLNDHWDDMKKYGFINNRVFDALACKAVLINDDFDELKKVLPGVITYNGREELLSLINDIYSNPEVYKKNTEKLYSLIISKHTVDKRVEEFLNILNRFYNDQEQENRFSYDKGIKEIVKKFILKSFGYGKTYVFAQKTYQNLKNIKDNINNTQTKNKIVERINNANVVSSYYNNSDINALARSVVNEFKGFNGKNKLVSIILPNKNGKTYLQKLVPFLIANTPYKTYELLVIDNNSEDGSQQYIRNLKINNYRVLEAKDNLNYAQNINFGVKKARGEYLVFLENNVLPLYGWLDELLNTYNEIPNCGVVGSRIIYDELNVTLQSGRLDYPGCLVYHDGIKFLASKNFIAPYNVGKFINPLQRFDEELCEIPAVSITSMLTDKKTFLEVGGFDEELNLGNESVDYCLKVNKLGKKIYINKKSMLIYKNNSNEKKEDNEKENFIFNNKWNSYLYEKVWNEKIENNTNYWITSPLHIAFLVTEYSSNTTVGDLFSAKGLGDELEKNYGYRVSYFPRRPVYEWDNIPESVDIVISMLHDFDIRKSNISPRTIKLAWVRSYIDKWIENPGIDTYDGIVTSSQIATEKIAKFIKPEKVWGTLPLAASRDFITTDLNNKRDIDVCFVGNIFQVPRQVVECLDLSKDFNFRFYGRLETGCDDHPWKPYHMGKIKHTDLPKVYKRSKIIIEDTLSLSIGTVNIRVFEAVASGALVISNKTPGLNQIFNNTILEYENKNDLTEKILYYLKNDEERIEKAKEAQRIVLEKHTFSNRAFEFKEILKKHILKK